MRWVFFCAFIGLLLLYYWAITALCFVYFCSIFGLLLHTYTGVWGWGLSGAHSFAARFFAAQLPLEMVRVGSAMGCWHVGRVS